MNMNKWSTSFLLTIQNNTENLYQKNTDDLIVAAELSRCHENDQEVKVEVPSILFNGCNDLEQVTLLPWALFSSSER